MYRPVSLLVVALLASLSQAQAFYDPTRPAEYSPAQRDADSGEQTWVLSSIIRADDRRLARINGAWVGEGERIGSARVVRIDSLSVEIRQGERVLRLSLGQSLNKQPAGGND